MVIQQLNLEPPEVSMVIQQLNLEPLEVSQLSITQSCIYEIKYNAIKYKTIKCKTIKYKQSSINVLSICTSKQVVEHVSPPQELKQV